MHRYSPVRNQRSNGVKIKHVLRICFLIAVCCWLIFQIKRSHYKKKDWDSKILSTTNSVDQVIKLGRKDLQPEIHEEEEEDEIEEEKDDENDQYKFVDEEDTVNKSEEKDGQSQTAREEHYKADDASSAVTHQHDNQTFDNSKFLEMGISNQETGSKSANEVNVSSNHGQYDSDSTRVIEESETSFKSSNMSAGTILTTKENDDFGSSEREAETEGPDEVQHDAIDSTDSGDDENSENTAAE